MLSVIKAKGDVLVPETYLNQSDADRDVFVVQGCNAQGVMGSGLAKQVKSKFIRAFEAYRKDFNKPLTDVEKKELLGKVSVARYDRPNGLSNLIICNAITQFTYGFDKRVRYTSYDAVDLAVVNLIKRITEIKNRNASVVIAIPKLFASDRGNADWGVVKKLIKSRLEASSLYVTLYIVEHDV